MKNTQRQGNVADWPSSQPFATHLHQGKALFPPVGEFSSMGYREQKQKESIVKGLFQHSNQSGCPTVCQLDNPKIEK